MINIDPVPDGRKAGSLTWAGLFNTYYWIDPRRCGSPASSDADPPPSPTGKRSMSIDNSSAGFVDAVGVSLN